MKIELSDRERDIIVMALKDRLNVMDGNGSDAYPDENAQEKAYDEVYTLIDKVKV